MTVPAVVLPPSQERPLTARSPGQDVPAPGAQAWRYGWLLPVAGLLPLLLSLPNQLQEIDPPQYAEVARRIAATGEWVKLYDAWGDFLNKPPMTMWLIALCIKLLGAGSVAARLPSLLAACFSVWAVSRIGTRLWDRRTGYIAAGFLAASPAIHLAVLDPKIDAVVTAFICATVLFALEARH